MPQATLRWSDVAYSVGVSASLAWDVIADDMAQAVAAVPVVAGSTHPKDSSLTATAPNARANGGPTTWVVSVSYSPAGEDSQDKDREKPQIQWSRSVTREQVDRDADGNPILNSAGDPFDPPPERDFGDRGFSIFRQESGYDLALAERYEDTVNQGAVTFLGRYRFDDGQLKLDSYLPTGRFAYDAKTIEVEYRFSFRRDGWDWRLIDQGRNGFATVNGSAQKLPFYGADGTQLSVDVPLDGYGAPIESTVKVGSGLAASRRAPNSPPKGATVEKGDAAAFLKYKRYKRLPFAGLQL